MIQRIYIIENEDSGERFALTRVHTPTKDGEEDVRDFGMLNEGDKIVDTLTLKDGGKWVCL